VSRVAANVYRFDGGKIGSLPYRRRLIDVAVGFHGSGVCSLAFRLRAVVAIGLCGSVSIGLPTVPSEIAGPFRMENLSNLPVTLLFGSDGHGHQAQPQETSGQTYRCFEL